MNNRADEIIALNNATERIMAQYSYTFEFVGNVLENQYELVLRHRATSRVVRRYVDRSQIARVLWSEAYFYSVWRSMIQSFDSLITVRPSQPAVKIEKVIFNGPATIVFWSDHTKTIVKAQNGESVDQEKGLAMAISKKYLGNEGNYYNTFKRWID